MTTAVIFDGGKFANGAVTAAFSRAFNDELHLEAGMRVPRWLGKLIFGENYIGQGGEIGLAVSYPGVTGGELDAGVYVTLQGGGEDFGVGHAKLLGVGFGAGDVQGMNGVGGEMSFNDGVGGLSLAFDDRGNFSGAGVHVGAGYNVGGAGTVTRAFTVRDAVDWVMDRTYGN
jgi:hypothetical protein